MSSNEISSGVMGSSKVVKHQLLELLSPISFHHGVNFLAAVAVAWHERRQPTTSKKVKEYQSAFIISNFKKTFSWNIERDMNRLAFFILIITIFFLTWITSKINKFAITQRALAHCQERLLLNTLQWQQSLIDIRVIAIKHCLCLSMKQTVK